MAFFPCIKFCSVMEQMQHEDFYDASQWNCKNFGTVDYYRRKWEVLRGYSQERFYFYDIALMLTGVVQIKGLRMIVENPYHPVNFTNHFWFVRPSLIDKDRTRRGDYFRKPTAYWYINCAPTYGLTEQPTPKSKVKTITSGSGTQMSRRKAAQLFDKEQVGKQFIGHSSQTGLCDEERSMISPDYARNFICDFILGKEQRYTQMAFDF